MDENVFCVKTLQFRLGLNHDVSREGGHLSHLLERTAAEEVSAESDLRKRAPEEAKDYEICTNSKISKNVETHFGELLMLKLIIPLHYYTF